MNKLVTQFAIEEGDSPRKIHSFKGSLTDLNKQINDLGRNSSFGEKITTDFTKLQNKAQETQKSLQAIQTTRLDAGNINHLTREIVRASERSRQLSLDIAAIKKELANPNRKSSIAFLTNELRAAEREADQLDRKLSTLPSSSGQTGARRGGSGGGGRRGRITDVQATVLELTDDFAPAGFNRPFNAAARGMFALNAISTASLATFGAIAAAGYGIVKVTEHIREEAEKRLKVEEQIQGAINKQILSQKEALENLQEARRNAQFDRDFSRELETGSIEQLKARRATIEKLISLTPSNIGDKPNETFQRLQSQLIALDAQINQIPLGRQKTANDAFNQRWESWKKSQEDASNAQKRQAEEFKKSVEAGREKVKDLGKQYESVLDSLYQKTGTNNPFVSLFLEADKSLKTLRENTRGLSSDLVSTFERMEQKANGLKLFETRLNNNLDAFDLRETADRFRNPQDPNAQKRFIEEVVKNNISRGNFFQNGVFGTYGSFLSNKAGGFDKLTDEQKRSIYEVSLLSNFTSGTLNSNSLISALANERVKNPNQSINDRLQKQLEIIYSGAASADEKAIADRRLIGLTSSLNPNEIARDLREQIALANEREALRRGSAEKDANKLRAEELEVQKAVASDIKRLREIAEKEGNQGIQKALVEIVDKTNGGAKVLGNSGSPEDVARAYNEYQNNL